jgi:hypothetical protein
LRVLCLKKKRHKNEQKTGCSINAGKWPKATSNKDLQQTSNGQVTSRTLKFAHVGITLLSLSIYILVVLLAGPLVKANQLS